jgi:2-polyprenyl-6-methoxyphenol hydroxylase-like FAD-dependent oxidoreductase
MKITNGPSSPVRQGTLHGCLSEAGLGHARGRRCQEWERFAKSNGTAFPYCQHSHGGLAVHSNSFANDSCGVVLVGDAAHAFPPEGGQGVKAGLADVMALNRALRGEDIVRRSSTNSFAVGSPPTTVRG